MKQSLTELVFIIDKSGSMSGLESDTIGGFNSMLKKQKCVEGECNVTTVFFNNDYYLLHDRVNIKAVSEVTPEQYQVGGSTALLDAIGKTVEKIVKVQKSTAKEYKAKRVMFVIITDGEENASNKFSSNEIKVMIECQTTKYGWEFIFLGANIDAVETANSIGIKSNRTANFHADNEGVSLNMVVLEETISCFRTSVIEEGWANSIKKDFKKRSSKK